MKGAAKLGRVLGPFLGLLLVILLFTVLDLAVSDHPTFFTSNTFVTVVTQTVIVALAALGMTLIIISGGIDLSVGSIIALVTVVTALVCRDLEPEAPVAGPLIGALAGIAIGGACGLISGLLITALRVVPFIITLGMMGIVRGVAKWWSNMGNVNSEPGWLGEVLKKEASPGWFDYPPGVLLLVLSAVAFGLALRYTVLGRYTYAIGSNEATARLCGIRVPRIKVLIYTIGGLSAGLAGVMQFSRLRLGDSTVAQGLELDVIAAVVIGGGSLSGGEGSILGSVLGALIISFLRAGITSIGGEDYLEEILTGAIIIAAVAIDRLRHRREAS